MRCFIDREAERKLSVVEHVQSGLTSDCIIQTSQQSRATDTRK